MRTKRIVVACAALALAVAAYSAAVDVRGAEKAAKGPALVHNVFFSLKDSSAEARKSFIASCKKYLTKHPGEVYFAAGPIVPDLKRGVNDTEFDVCLTIVFEDRAAHDKYQDAKRHLAFIEENKAGWKKVRVFDSYAD